MREHNNSIPSLIRDFKEDCKTINLTYRERLLLAIIDNLNERILALEHEQILKDDGKNQ